MADDAPRSESPFARHSRSWRDGRFVYPVISRRSHGLSVGINLNPDAACNFDCVYCQVDRSYRRDSIRVNPAELARELDVLLSCAQDGSLFDDPRFRDTPPELRRINDIAFSGDGEPTTCPVFSDCVRAAADAKSRHAPHDVKLILITDACYLTKPEVVTGLEALYANNGEVWAKLDAGTQAYFERVNRPSGSTLDHVIESITATARRWPVCIQSLWMRLDGCGPSEEEVAAFIDHLVEMLESGAQLQTIQVYTVARRPAEAWVSALSVDELRGIADRIIRRTSLQVQVFGTA